MPAGRTYTDVVDRAGWAPGPWDDEPDKVQWRDQATGLPCLVVRGPMGSWCGYVGVAEGHPAFEAHYSDVDVDVHGGLTFAAACDDGPEQASICHVPEPGEPDHVWWLGFDCAHAWDFRPGSDAVFRSAGLRGLPPGGVYRDLGYVERECAQLAQQLAEMV